MSSTIAELVEKIDSQIQERSEEIAKLKAAKASLGKPLQKDTLLAVAAPSKPAKAKAKSSNGGRAPSGSTRMAVIEALKAAAPESLSAGDLAARTGLGRASVSTTASKLVKAGEIEKAEKGYRAVSAPSFDEQVPELVA